MIEQLLSVHKLGSVACIDTNGLLEALSQGAAVAIVTEEAIDASALACLEQWIGAQPVWFDFPFVVLTAKRSVKASTSLRDMSQPLAT